MSKRTGKFIGAYIPNDIKRKLQKQARQLDRPLAWLIEKILAEGVKHPTPATQQPLKEAA